MFREARDLGMVDVMRSMTAAGNDRVRFPRQVDKADCRPRFALSFRAFATAGQADAPGRLAIGCELDPIMMAVVAW